MILQTLKSLFTDVAEAAEVLLSYYSEAVSSNIVELVSSASAQTV